MNPEIEIYGHITGDVLFGHAYLEGKEIAAVMLRLPQDLLESGNSKSTRGRPTGRRQSNIEADIKVLAASEIVSECLMVASEKGMTNGKKATVAELAAAVRKILNPSKQEDWEEAVDEEKKDDKVKLFQRQRARAKKELTGFTTALQVDAKNMTGTWVAFSEDSRAWCYELRGELKQCVIQKTQQALPQTKTFREKKTK